MNKKAAMEMSVGTIVTIVLLMGVLVMGIFLIQRIFISAKGAIDLTDQQLKDQINKLFAEESDLVIYPQTKFVEIKQENTDSVGIGIRNVLTGTAGTKKFSYVVEAKDVSNCGGLTEERAKDFISVGRAEDDIPIAVGDFSVQRVLFEIPVGAPLCTIRYRVIVTPEGAGAFSDFFDIKIKPK